MIIKISTYILIIILVILGTVPQGCWDRCPQGCWGGCPSSAGAIPKMLKIGGAPEVLGRVSQGCWDGCPKGAGASAPRVLGSSHIFQKVVLFFS